MTKASLARKKRRGPDYRMVHELVATTAKEIAGVYYENAASNGRHGNTFYEAFPDQATFVKRQWPMFVMTAKEIMTSMLGNPGTPDAQKQDIYHALLLDATLPYSQQEAQMTNFRVH